MRTSKKFSVNLIFILGWLFLFGCINQPLQVQPTRLSITDVTSNAIATLEPSPSSTLVLIPQDNTPEINSLNTVPYQSSDEAIFELYDDICKLPCWWDITPGTTSIEDVYRRFASLGKFTDMKSAVDTMNHTVFTFIPPKEIDLYEEGQWSFALVDSNGLVKGITVGARHLKSFSNPTLAQILATFGEPGEIWISVQEHQLSPPSFYMDLFYPKIGIIVLSKGDANLIAKMNDGINLSICPKNVQTIPNNQVDNEPISFHLWNPNETSSHHKLTITHLADEDNYRLLDTLTTQMDEENFYTVYMNPETATCFSLFWKWNP